jgi:hypothetical protein
MSRTTVPYACLEGRGNRWSTLGNSYHVTVLQVAEGFGCVSLTYVFVVVLGPVPACMQALCSSPPGDFSTYLDQNQLV